MEKPKRFEERELYRRFRYRMIRQAGCRCELCGRCRPLKLVYIKEIAVFSELALSPDNAKIICNGCLPTWSGSNLDGHVSFYQRPEWKRLRAKVIENQGMTCRHCHRTPDAPSDVHVDHIRPRYIYPELSFTLGNLQPLCADCNMGKGATDYENTVTKSLVDQHADRVRARAKSVESRYLSGIARHISEGANVSTLVGYINFRIGLRREYAHPHRLEALIWSVDADLKLIETAAGETFDLFTVAG